MPKPGDKYRVLPKLKVNFPAWSHDMHKRIGTIVTLHHANNTSCTYWTIEEDYGSFTWPIDCLEPVPAEHEIVKEPMEDKKPNFFRMYDG